MFMPSPESRADIEIKPEWEALWYDWPQGKWRVLYRRPLSFFKDALRRRESTEEHFSRSVYAAQTFFSPPAVWAMQIYTLKLWKATSGWRGGPSPTRRLMHSQFLGVARAPSACQPAGIFLLSSLHLVEILFCILLRVIITRQALSPRSLKVADLTLTCAEFLFRRNITFFRRRTERNAKLCVKMQMTSRRNAKKAQNRHWAACAMVDHSTHFKTH